jgi:RNase P subunit RPR2
MSEYEAYCVKCRAKRPMKDVRVITNEKGRRIAKGVCAECGTKMNLFLKSGK